MFALILLGFPVSLLSTLFFVTFSFLLMKMGALVQHDFFIFCVVRSGPFMGNPVMVCIPDTIRGFLCFSSYMSAQSPPFKSCFFYYFLIKQHANCVMLEFSNVGLSQTTKPLLAPKTHLQRLGDASEECCAAVA